MADRRFSSLPRILLARGGRSPRGLLGVSMPPNVPVPPSDLDFVGFRVPWSAPDPRVESVWLPSHVLDAPGKAIAARLGAACGASLPAAVVVDLPCRGDPDVGAVARISALQTSLHGGGGTAPPMLGLRANHLMGGRQHLALLTAWRRLAEEWDIGFALDLTGPFDPQWEAEAAVVRMGKRLLLIRVGSAAIAPSPLDRARVARRALLAAIERAPNAAVSIEPPISWWRPFASDERGRDWLDAEQRLRRWLAPPSIDDAERPGHAGRRSPRQFFPPA